MDPETEVIDNPGEDLRAVIAELEAPEGQTVDSPGSGAGSTPAAGGTPAGGGQPGGTTQPNSVPANPQSNAQEGKVAAPAGQGTTQPTLERAPVSWKPLAREKWATIDPEVRAEVLRREQQVNEVLRTTSEARKLQDQFTQLTQPYAHFFQQENSTPIQGYQNYLQTAALLRVGTPQQKADTIAGLVTTFGIDVELLDQMLQQKLSPEARAAGGSPAAVPPQMLQLLDQRLQPVQALLQTFQQRQQESMQQAEQAAQQTLEEFIADPANEFVEDVREDMADLLELAAKRGQPLSLSEAYKRATLAHPQIAEVIAARQARQGAAKRTQAAARALDASASLPSSGAPAQTTEEESDGSVRADLLAAVRQHSSSR